MADPHERALAGAGPGRGAGEGGWGGDTRGRDQQGPLPWVTPPSTRCLNTNPVACAAVRTL